MRSSRFTFKQFAVEQSGAAMKIGTDGVLLGAWADVANANRVLDIGTGTGVIALMMAQRGGAQRIVGVDIEKFDLILSNPPYFTDSLLSPDSLRTMARHTTSLTLEQLDASVSRLLEKSGRFALILPTEQMERYLALTQLNLVRRCDVRSRSGSETIRTMAELSFNSHKSVVYESLTIYEDEGQQYAAQYRELTKDFYLKF